MRVSAKSVLRFGAATLIGIGLAAAAAAWPALAAPIGFLIDVVFWPLDGAQSLAAPETRLLLAIAGGLLCGWGATLWIAVERLDSPAAGELVRAMILWSFPIWFVVDSLGSLAAGAPVNALMNIGFLALFLAPLAGLAKAKPA